jgi:hypothetical protein
VVVAEVSIEHPIQMRFHRPDVLLGSELRRRELADGRRQSYEPVAEPDEPLVDESGPLPRGCFIRGTICLELRLLVEQKLHHPLHLFERHRLKIHEQSSLSALSPALCHRPRDDIQQGCGQSSLIGRMPSSDSFKFRIPNTILSGPAENIYCDA